MGVTKKVGLFEAKTHLSALVEEARLGAEIEITRRGETVAKIVPARSTTDWADAHRAALEIRAQSKSLSLDGLKIKDLIEEGRM